MYSTSKLVERVTLNTYHTLLILPLMSVLDKAFDVDVETMSPGWDTVGGCRPDIISSYSEIWLTVTKPKHSICSPIQTFSQSKSNGRK